jgi:molybdopterin converting factor small subunit
MTKVTVRLFGPLARTAGNDRLEVTLPHAQPRCGDVLGALPPYLAGHRLAVNHEYVSHDTVLQPDDEVALIGMVSGG